MAEKMTRRSFIKGAAAAAAVLSLSGMLAGCGGTETGTDLGGFTASAVKWEAKSYEPGIGEDENKWYADFKAVVQVRNLKADEIRLPGELVFELKIDGKEISLQDGGLLPNGVLVLAKNEVKQDTVNFRLEHGQEELYNAMKAGTAKIQLTIGFKTTETYTAVYEGRTFTKDDSAQ